ncbi:DUF3606 domain-containing protein [Variovorax sp. J22P168]|uniref:DUF3606 domain-containing protein n=1 Tax=Variovorax jilinensis TaxID=3053513 RepID=UPI0025777743|nr:DUF3606 domain-containing protein [Variovorax sp. J22P168]MDM0013638.1 DUF3606 domain-containing protein [Variovorax sp. J22P168]
MADDLHVLEDRSSTIDINQASEVDLWCQRLGVSEMALRQAVADVGASPEQIAVHLGKK